MFTLFVTNFALFFGKVINIEDNEFSHSFWIRGCKWLQHFIHNYLIIEQQFYYQEKFALYFGKQSKLLIIDHFLLQ